MATIAINQDVVTLVNVFSVDPDRQQPVIDVLVEATRAVMIGLPGFVSANIHRSLDGVKVVNYTQWRTTRDFEAMLRNAAAQKHMRSAEQLAISIEPHLYTVVFTDQVQTAP